MPEFSLDLFQLNKSNNNNREVIKVVGVGGGGNNALNHIIRGGVTGVDFIAANTDQAHLDLSEATHRIVLGKELTKGLGAGADPSVGQKAALESRDEIRSVLEGADMVFIAAGMGGGTGTGASPVIAGIAREAGTLVVAVVTRPFMFEGKRRLSYAAEGIDRLREQVDALIVIPNDRLLSIADKRTSLGDAFKLVDNVLHQAVQGVTDLILRPGLVNVDFADARTIMSNAGAAIMGIGEGYGENRITTAAHNAINSPLMETPMVGAKGVLFNISAGANVSIHEVNEAATIINNSCDEDAHVIWGHVFDPELEDAVKITVIATGFDVLPKETAKQPAVQAAPLTGAVTRVGTGQQQQQQQQQHQMNTPRSYSAQIKTQQRVKPELDESSVRLAGEAEDLFRTSGAPTNKLDEPAVLRRKK